MLSLNRIELIGHLCRNPEIRETENGHVLTAFTVATNHDWKDRHEEFFHNVVAWDTLGEICRDPLHKGDRIFVEGRLHGYQYEKDDTLYTKLEVVADQMILLSRSEVSPDNLTSEDPEEKKAPEPEQPPEAPAHKEPKAKTASK